MSTSWAGDVVNLKISQPQGQVSYPPTPNPKNPIQNQVPGLGSLNLPGRQSKECVFPTLYLSAVVLTLKTFLLQQARPRRPCVAKIMLSRYPLAPIPFPASPAVVRAT